MFSNDEYNNDLKAFASALRKSTTKSEACLWKYCLRAKKTGYNFKRQRPILNYIVDFYCHEVKLIIEVDGITHSYENVAEMDVYRDDELHAQGFQVLRFTSEEVLTSIQGVFEKIVCVCNELEKKWSSR